jgi:hypothetical protein
MHRTIPADVRRLIREMSIANPTAEPQGWPLFADSTEEKDPLANGTTIAGRCRAPLQLWILGPPRPLYFELRAECSVLVPARRADQG